MFTQSHNDDNFLYAGSFQLSMLDRKIKGPHLMAKKIPNENMMI